jgi:hypothetical protein
MKCERCGTKNEPKSKFCRECGLEFANPTDSQVTTPVSELFGKEVDVLFFIEQFTGKISGIVNPTEDQISRYRDGILQRITIDSGSNNATDETVGTILTFIRQSKEYLGEDYNENYFRNFSATDLKKEYLRLFERILKAKALRQEPKPTPPPDKNVKK